LTRIDSKHPRIPNTGLFAVVSCAGVLVCYAFCLQLPFFFDDLPIASWLSGHEIRDIWLGQEGGYYRPLTYFLYSFGLLFPRDTAQIYLHGFNMAFLWLSAYMLANIVQVLVHDRRLALIAGGMLPFYPFLSQTIPWITAMAHPLVLTLCLGATWSALVAVSSPRPIVYWCLSTLAIALAPLAHESGFVSSALVMAFLIAHRSSSWRHAVAPAIGALLNVLTLVTRSFLPHTASATEFRGLQDLFANTMFFVQGLLYPMGPAVRIATASLGWHDLTTTLVSFALVVSRGCPNQKLVMAGLLWWTISALPAGLSMRYADLYIAPRLYTLSAAGAVLFWVGLYASLARLRGPLGSVALAALVILTVGQDLHYINRQRSLYLALDRVYDEVLEICRDSGDGAKLGVVNLPAGLFHEQRTYALVTEDVLFIPPYSNLAEFVAVNRTRCTATSVRVESIAQETNPTWLAQGEALSATDFRAFASEQDLVAVTHYYLDSGDFVLDYAGQVHATGDSSCVNALARFESGPLLCGTNLTRDQDGTWLLTLDWLAREPIAATVFVHVVDGDGVIVGQADGPAMRGTLPLEAWLRGDRIVDVRTLSIPPEAEGSLTVLVGVYAETGRYPVWIESQTKPSDAVVVGRIAP